MENANSPPAVGLGTLLRSLTAQLDPVVDRIYADTVPAMKSRYYPVMRALAEREQASIGELAAVARVSQPAMTQTVRQMVEAGLLSSDPAADRRARTVRLSRDGMEAVQKLRPIWKAVAGAARSLELDMEISLESALKQALAALEAKDFAARIAEEREQA